MDPRMREDDKKGITAWHTFPSRHSRESGNLIQAYGFPPTRV